jgi:hypothetical protein
MEVCPDHTEPPVRLGDATAPREHGERRISVIPEKEPYFLPPVWRTGRQEVEVRINSAPRSNKDVQTIQSRCFRAQALS